MNYKEAINVLGDLLDAFDRDEHGDYFYEHGWEVCEATILAHGALQEQPHWISVEDRLPDEWRDNSGELVNYLIYMPEYGVDVGNYALPVKKWICMGLPCKVTHWMPLPEPPKEEV